MPSNSQGRKRKQPASPSTTNSRPSPYHPNTNDTPRAARDRANRGRRQSNNPPQQQQNHHQSSPNIQRTNSRLSQNSVSRETPPIPAPAPTAPGMSSTNSGTAPPEEGEDIRLDSPPPSAPKAVFLWEYVTDEVLRDWNGSGSSTIRSQVEELATGGTANEIDITIVFQELIKSVLDERIAPSDVAPLIATLVELPDAPQLKRIFLQSVSPYEKMESTVPAHPKLIELLNALHPHPYADETLGLILEGNTLQALGVVSGMFARKAVRITTGMVYKQRKHNLLREETEGFSKLITEFFTASYSSNPMEVVGRTGERVKGLIGSFELDPGRVLDILLDTAACTVVSNARFFVRLLKGSAWWPQQLEKSLDDDPTKGREEVRQEREKEAERQDREFFDKLAKEGIAAFFEKFDTPRGNKVAAQLLGFKFRYYQQDDVREQTPENLLVLSALLIKSGFIDLADLYPHLAPQDDAGMNDLLTAWKAKMEEKTTSGRRNALMMAGALADDTMPMPRGKPTGSQEDKKPEESKKEEEKPRKKDDNQKLVLLKYLLAVGALPEALFILAKYPWLPGPSDDIVEHLARVLLQAINTVYTPEYTAPIGQKKIAVALNSKTGGVELYDQPRRKPMVTFTVSNLKLMTGDIEYRFFWDEWKEGVPVCRTPSDVVVLMKTLGRVLGVRVGTDASLMTRVCRIGKRVLSDPACSEADRDEWINLCRNLIVPAVSLTDGNQGVVNEVWTLLACFPTETRYSLYGEWTQVAAKRTTELKIKIQAVEKETRDLLKRISKTNIQQIARQLAKVATSNPVTVMQVVLKQVEGYDNFIECIVDAARYFTPLGYDTVGFCVLDSISNQAKNRVQADGMLTSKWLQALAVFCGKIYTRYYRQMDPSPILEYVARQLKQNHSVELVVLQEIVQSMAGVVPESNLNDAQLQGLAGGDCLRRQVLMAFRDKKAEDNDKTMDRLTKTLFDKHLAAELLILIAQERQTCIFRLAESEAPLKVLANLSDEIHMVFTQYLDVVKAGLSPEKFEETVPSVSRLCLEFGLDPEIAWWISRGVLRHKMKKVESIDTEGDVEMQDASDSPESLTPPKTTPWNPILEKTMEEFRPVFADNVWAKFSPGFYVTFWQLDIYDIFVPMDAYQAETNRLHAAIRALDGDRSDPSVPGQQKRRQERERMMNKTAALSAELKFHIRENSLIRKRLAAEKEYWFKNVDFNQRDITEGFIQYCVFPRVMLSPNDASFCSKFIREIHRIGTPKFHTIGVYDNIFGKSLGTVIFMSTQREAENYGRFLKELLTDLHAWHGSRDLYEREIHGAQKSLVGFNVKGLPFDWEDFRKILYKWHKTLHSAIKNCLSTKEYMHIRNAIVILKHVADFFPAVDWIGRTIVEKVEALVKVEKREDLKIAGMTLLGMLKRKEPTWKVVSEFQKSEGAPAAAMGNRPSPAPGSEKSGSPAPTQQQQQGQHSGSRPLSAVAKEYKPNTLPPTSVPTNVSQSRLNAPSLPAKPELGDKEDGEIDDNRNRRGAVQNSNLPQRPPQHPNQRTPQHPSDRRPPTPIRDGQQPPQYDNRQPPNRVPTPRHEDQRPINGRPQDRMDTRSPAMRGSIPQPQHQLPERPDISRGDMSRQSTLERRENIRDLREASRPSDRGRIDSRLPEKPDVRRHSPRRDIHPREVRRDDGRVTMGREPEFHRTPLPPQQWEERNRREERMPDADSRPMPGNPGARGLQQFIESDNRHPDRGDNRRRSDRQDQLAQQTGRLNDYPVERPDTTEHRMQDRNPEPLPQRHAPEPMPPRHAQEDMQARPPPAGPRGNFDQRDRRNQPVQPPPQPQQQKDRDLFQGPQGGNQMRAPPSAPAHPSEQFRDNRHPAPGSYHHQDPNHGRLNPPELTIPKGPRGGNVPFGPRGSLNIRGASAAAAAANQQQSQQQSAGTAPSTPRTQITSPVLDSGNKIDMPPPRPERVSQSAPSTPATEAPPGIHPDRLKAFESGQKQQPKPQHQAPQPARQTQATPDRADRRPPNVDAGPSMSSRVGRPNSPPPPAVPANVEPLSTGPSRRDGQTDEARNQRRRITKLNQFLGGEDQSRGARSRRNASNTGPPTPTDIRPQPSSRPDTPSNVQPTPPVDRRTSSANLREESRRSSLPNPAVEDRVDSRTVEHSSRSSRHHRSDRGDRDRDPDRRARDAEREREREREFSTAAGGSGRESRKGSDRGSKDRERGGEERGHREHRSERDRERRRGEKHPREPGSGEKTGREDKRRRRGADAWAA